MNIPIIQPAIIRENNLASLAFFPTGGQMKKTKNKIYKIIYNIHLFSCIKSFNKGRLII